MFSSPMYQHQPHPSSSHFHHQYPPDEYYGNDRFYDDRKRSTQFTKPSNKNRYHHGHRRSKSISKLDTLYDEDVYIRSNTVGPAPANRHYKNDNDFYYRNIEQQPHQQNDQFRDGAIRRRSATLLSDNTTASTTNYFYHNSINRGQEGYNSDHRRRHSELQQPTKFVNVGHPLMMNPMTSSNSYHHQPQQEGLGICTTDTNWFPTNQLFVRPPSPQANDMFIIPQNTTSAVPMIQPYFMQPQIANNSNTNYTSSLTSYYTPSLRQQQYHTNSNFLPLTMPSLLHPDIFSSALFSNNNNSVIAANNSNSSEIIETTEAPILTSRPVTPPPTINNEESAVSIVHHQQQKPPAIVLRRKKSLMEGILSTFSLLGDDTNFSTSLYYEQQKSHTTTSTGIDDISQEKQGTTTTNKDTATKNGNLSSITTTWNLSSYTSLSEAIEEVLNNDIQSNHQLTSLAAEGDHQVRDMMNNDSSISATSLNYYNNNAPRRRRKSPSRNNSSLSRNTSSKVFQKASALQNRPYIWCYRPLQKHDQSNASKAAAEEKINDSNDSSSSTATAASLWAAFDIKNQTMLDDHYVFILAKKAPHQQQFIGLEANNSRQPHQQQGENKLAQSAAAGNVTHDPTLILTLNKQSNIASPVMVSILDGLAWYYTTKKENDAAQQTTIIAYAFLEIAYLPTKYNRLVVSNDIIQMKKQEPQLRRSKSMDGFTSKLLNTVLRW
jgi:hypothetical protein